MANTVTSTADAIRHTLLYLSQDAEANGYQMAALHMQIAAIELLPFCDEATRLDLDDPVGWLTSSKVLTKNSC